MAIRKAGVIAATSAGLILGALAFPGAAMAAKGGIKGKTTATEASIELNAPTDARLAVDWKPARSEKVGFTTSYPKAKNPRVQVLCYQGDDLVYAEAGPVDWEFTLGGWGTDWEALGGGASCRADLFDLWWSGNNPQQVTFFASTSFEALAG